jgi:hypothetical protein
MRKNLRFSSLLLGSVFISALANSQSDRFAYVVTDIQKDGPNWNFLRKLNLRTGQFSEVLLNGTDKKQVAYDAATKKELTVFNNEINRGYNSQPAFSSGVAAMAYDKKNNRIWYTPMFIDQLRYIDLKTMKVFYVTDQPFTGMAKKSADQGNIVTRMTIADDGNGYALTNDGAHLLRFTTGKKLTVTDMGMLADDPAGKGVSIHSSCSSFGGDMIADDEGNLIVFSARNNVFKVNIETKVATHLGNLSGLPANYTANGAVVTADNKIMISSAMDPNSYIVDHKSLTATLYPAAVPGWKSSDLANSNILQTKAKADIAGKVIPETITPGSDAVRLFPNPVTSNQFAIHFAKLEAGEYTIQVTDVMGRQVMQKVVNVSGEDQTETVRLEASAAKGFYLVKVMDKNSKSVYTQKLIVQ